MKSEKEVAESIMKAYCEGYGLTVDNLRQRRPSGKGLESAIGGVRVSELRFALAHFFYVYSRMGAPEIVILLGFKERGSVWHAVKKAKGYLDTNDLTFTVIYRTLISTVNKWYVNMIQPEMAA